MRWIQLNIVHQNVHGKYFHLRMTKGVWKYVVFEQYRHLVDTGSYIYIWELKKNSVCTQYQNYFKVVIKNTKIVHGIFSKYFLINNVQNEQSDKNR